jgi:hypothetical protein
LRRSSFIVSSCFLLIEIYVSGGGFGLGFSFFMPYWLGFCEGLCRTGWWLTSGVFSCLKVGEGSGSILISSASYSQAVSVIKLHP